MTDYRVQEEYDNYEPETGIVWYVLLALIIPLIPFSVFLIINWGHFQVNSIIWNVIAYCALAFSLISAAIITRRGNRRGTLLLSAAIWVFVVIGEWALLRYQRVGDDYVLGIPIGYSLLTCLLPVFAYSFYSRRKRLPGWLLMLGLSSAVVLVVTFVYRIPNGVPPLTGYVLISMSALMILLALFILICTRRSEAAPWYINIVLSLLVLGSALCGRNFILYLKEGSVTFAGLVVNLCLSVVSDYTVAFYIAYCFVFASLGMKSCFRSLKRLDDSKYDENAETISEVDVVDEGYDNNQNGYQNNQEYPPYNSGRNDGYDRKDRLRYPEDVYNRRYQNSDRPYSDPYAPERYRDDDYTRGYEQAMKDMERQRADRFYSGDSSAGRRYIEDDRYTSSSNGNGYGDNNSDKSVKEQTDKELRKYRYGDEYRKRDKFFDLLRGEIPDDEYESHKDRR